MIHTLGRRKTAVARVHMTTGEGKVIVNGKEYTDYFPILKNQIAVQEPFKLTNNTGAYNVKVNVKVEDEARKLVADSDYLTRIFYNLVTNAVQAMPNGGTLSIAAHKEANDIVISVRDTGIGIPKDIQSKMFTPMFTTKSKGQGFGLPVVKRITESLGGTISFESQEGNGTTFTIRLPYKRNKL